jgi:hypothetical protein
MINRSPESFGRRAFLQAAGSFLPLILFNAADQAAHDQDPVKSSSPSDLIVRQSTPTNLEFPFATLDSFLTSNERLRPQSFPRSQARSANLAVENRGRGQANAGASLRGPA